MNKLEARYAAHLTALEATGEVLWWAYESIKFRLADNTWYTPDFVALYADGSLRVTETKGFLHDDAAVKFKAVADHYWWAYWQMISWKKGEWQTIYDL